MIDSARLMAASSLSNLVNNLADGTHKIKCKYGYDNKKCETGGIKYKDCECCLEYTNVRRWFNTLQMFMLLNVYNVNCNRNYQKKFHI